MSRLLISLAVEQQTLACSISKNVTNISVSSFKQAHQINHNEHRNLHTINQQTALFNYSSNQLKNYCNRHCPKVSLTNITSLRDIYSLSSLKVDKFIAQRDTFRKFCKLSAIKRIRDYIENPDFHAKLSFDDVRFMQFLSENEADLDSLDNLIRILCKNSKLQKRDTRVMLLYYEKNQADRAYKNLKNTVEFGNFFSTLASYQTAMTIMYDNGRFDDLLDLFELAKRRLNSNSAVSVLSLIVFATLYRIKNNAALDRAIELLNEIIVFEKPSRRKTTLVAGLALKLNKPKEALDILSTGLQSLTTIELTIASLVKLERFEDAMFYIRQIKGQVKLHTETVEIIRSATQSIEDEKLRQEVIEFLFRLKKSNSILSSLNDFLLHPNDEPSFEPANTTNVDNSGESRNHINDMIANRKRLRSKRIVVNGNQEFDPY